jgi:hypothetical protein
MSKLPLLTLFVALICAAQKPPDDISSLKGLNGGVQVLIEPGSSLAEKYGLTTTAIQTDVELRLREAGIRVLSSDETLKTPGMAFLYVNVDMLVDFKNKVIAYTVEASLHQRILLVRDKTIEIDAATWKKLIFGTVDVPDNLRSVRNVVKDLVDQFTNAYLSANPR